MCNWAENSPPTCVFSPGILPVCLFLITSNMHANALNNFAHEIYICSGLFTYSSNVIVFIFFFPLTKQLLMLQMQSEDLNILFGAQWDAHALPVPFLEWSRNTHGTTPRLYPLTSPEHPSPQSLGGPWVKVTVCWSTLQKENKEPCSNPYSLHQFCFLTSASFLPFPPVKTTSQPSWKATYHPYPKSWLCLLFLCLLMRQYEFHKLQRSLPCTSKPHIRRWTQKSWD